MRLELELAKSIGAYHLDCFIDEIIGAVEKFFEVVMSWTLKFKMERGSNTENLTR